MSETTLIGLACTNPDIRKERSQAIAEILKSDNNIVRLILSGGLIKGPTAEADLMEDDILEITDSIPSGVKLVLDNQSTNTDKSMKTIRELTDDFGGDQRYIFVSSASHLWRLKKELSQYQNVERKSAEEISGLRSLQLRRIAFWLYEFARPLKNIRWLEKACEIGKKNMNRV